MGVSGFKPYITIWGSLGFGVQETCKLELEAYPISLRVQVPNNHILSQI